MENLKMNAYTAQQIASHGILTKMSVKNQQILVIIA
jgi:hypothetical protein